MTVLALSVLTVIFAFAAYAYPNRVSMASKYRRHSFAIHLVGLFDSSQLTVMLVLADQDYPMDFEWVNWLLLMNFDFSSVVASAVPVIVEQLGQP